MPEEQRINEINISQEMRSSFLDYAMSVIVSRALPDVRDGLKPVHRRILYTMHELGMTSDKPYRKSANVVGNVLASYHPHGDAAVYDTMVRMAQDFSYRYMLVDGHGNFGSVDGDSPAAMRYTEARMAPITRELLRDIEKETIDFTPNYDGRSGRACGASRPLSQPVGERVGGNCSRDGHQHSATQPDGSDQRIAGHDSKSGDHHRRIDGAH